MVNDRLGRLRQSEIRIMSIECEKAGGINLSQGICDLPLPDVLIKGAETAIENGVNHYTRYDGLYDLKAAISGKLERYNGIYASPEYITVTAGSTGAFYCACMALLEPGDEVILFEPFYGYHEYTLLSLDAKPVYVQFRQPGFGFDPDEIIRVITPKTKGIMINTPANPSGKVFSSAEIEILADICVRYDLMIFTDEIYEYIVYDGRHVSPASFAQAADRCITISGYSKTFSITGWRIGYCACRPDSAAQIGIAHDLVYVCAPSPLQAGVCAGICNLADSFYTDLKSEYKKKRDLICGTLREVSLIPFIPQGAYYVLADASPLKGSTSKEKAMYLLDQTGIAAVPGSAFYHGDGGENILRFCFAKEQSVLEKACERLRKLKKFI